MKEKNHFTVSLCLTHKCNLDCVYCFQKHDKENEMSFQTAQKCIDWLFENRLKDEADVEISFIGGEPLFRFDLIKEIFEYTRNKETNNKIVFFVSTNGTLLNEKMKIWFTKHRDRFCLGLSLDGTRSTHNSNRSNSYDLIDFEFFLENWPNQNVKMTLSEQSLCNLAENVKHIHSLGFGINGADLSEGFFDWSDEKYLKRLIPQLKKLVEFYVENNHIKLNKLFDKDLASCAVKNKHRKKYCGVGDNLIFFDTDGSRYPCSYITPMTFPQEDINDISRINFLDDNAFIDDDCYQNCYIYPICNTCVGANYLINKSFKQRDKRKCKIRKLIALFIADLQSKLIIRNPQIYNSTKLYYTIEAIKNIKKMYLEEFSNLSIIEKQKKMTARDRIGS